MYTWATFTDAAASQGAYFADATSGASATFTFTGTSVTWHGFEGPDQGIAGVKIDNGTETVASTYAATRAPKAITISGLANGPHTITIRVTGTKAAASSGTTVVVDGFSVNGTPSASAPVFNWATETNSKAEGNTLVTTTSSLAGAATGAIASIRYRDANYIAVRVVQGPNQGKVRVSVDGQSQVVDLYKATPTIFYVSIPTWTYDPTHVATIEVLNQKNAASTGFGVTIDGWYVFN